MLQSFGGRSWNQNASLLATVLASLLHLLPASVHVDYKQYSNDDEHYKTTLACIETYLKQACYLLIKHIKHLIDVYLESFWEILEWL